MTEINSVEDIVSKIKDEDLGVSRISNFMIITSEFQTYMKVMELLMDTLSPAWQHVVKSRLCDLEVESRNELLKICSILVEEGGLIETPIYPDDMCEDLFNFYVATSVNPGLDDESMGNRDEGVGCGLAQLANMRSKSKISFFANAPVFKVAEFIESEAYINIIKDDKYSNDDIAKLHETLMYVVTLSPVNFDELLEVGRSNFYAEVIDSLGLGDVVPF